MAKPVSTVLRPCSEGTELTAQDYCGFFTNIDQTMIQWHNNCHSYKMLEQ
jgi:hypothetical protein